MMDTLARLRDGWDEDADLLDLVAFGDDDDDWDDDDWDDDEDDWDDEEDDWDDEEDEDDWDDDEDEDWSDDLALAASRLAL